MITNISTQNHKPLMMSQPSFKGDKDILIIDDTSYGMDGAKLDILEILDDKSSQYNIYTAKGGKEGLKKAKEIKPLFTVTSYNMPELRPDAGDLISKLKNAGTKVIVKTMNWYGNLDEARKSGVATCEDIYGADKYVYEMDKTTFQNTVQAILDNKEIPRYSFQQTSKSQNNIPQAQPKDNWFTRLINTLKRL